MHELLIFCADAVLAKVRKIVLANSQAKYLQLRVPGRIQMRRVQALMHPVALRRIIPKDL